MTELVINAEPIEAINLTLVGEQYKIKPPKSALAMKFATQAKQAGEDPGKLMEAIGEWVKMAFGKDASKVMARLDKPEDDLDVQHIMTLMQKIMELQTGDPTT